MKIIIIKTQKEFNLIKTVMADEEVVFEADNINIGCVLEVYGVLRLKGEINSSWDGRLILARGSSQVHSISRDSSQVHSISWGTSIISILGQVSSLILHGFSVVMLPFNLKIKIKKEKLCIVQRVKSLPYLQREGVDANRGKVILFKRVSVDWKTQEGTKNETRWIPGSVLAHPNWEPDKQECGGGKYHACSRPYFCDEFRNMKGDKYIAIEIAKKDLYEWPDPSYPHKIAFREGRVLHECDKYGGALSPHFLIVLRSATITPSFSLLSPTFPHKGIHPNVAPALTLHNQRRCRN